MPDYRLSLDEMITILEKAIDTFFENHSLEGQEEKRAREAAVAATLEYIRNKSEAEVTKGDTGTTPRQEGGVIFIVEFRQHVASGLDQGNRLTYSKVIAHIASSLDKAVEWCKANANYEEHNMDKLWDFAIRKREVDGDLRGGGLFMILDWDGEISGWRV